MGAAAPPYTFLSATKPYTSSSSPNHHHQSKLKNDASSRLGLAMRDLTLRRISPNLIPTILINNKNRFPDLKPFSVSSLKEMATANNQACQSAEENTKAIGGGGKEDLEKSPPPPPPPEKPEPGDCCGSGCVRCVWDVYYEELDAYNELYKTNDSEPAS